MIKNNLVSDSSMSTYVVENPSQRKEKEVRKGRVSVGNRDCRAARWSKDTKGSADDHLLIWASHPTPTWPVTPDKDSPPPWIALVLTFCPASFWVISLHCRTPKCGTRMKPEKMVYCISDQSLREVEQDGRQFSGEGGAGGFQVVNTCFSSSLQLLLKAERLLK